MIDQEGVIRNEKNRNNINFSSYDDNRSRLRTEASSEF